MPWKQTCPMDEKIEFVAAVNTHQSSFAEVCREFGISRKSGYALMRRYEREGPRGLLARSRASVGNHKATASQPKIKPVTENTAIWRRPGNGVSARPV